MAAPVKACLFCNRPAEARRGVRGLCQSHSNRWRACGRPDLSQWDGLPPPPGPYDRNNPQFITANGLTLPLREWAKRLGVSVCAIYRRLKFGVDPIVAVTARVLPRGGMAVEINGVRYGSLSAVARAFGLNERLVGNRFREGLRGSDLVAPAIRGFPSGMRRKARVPPIVYRGKIYSPVLFAEFLGVHRKRIHVWRKAELTTEQMVQRAKTLCSVPLAARKTAGWFAVYDDLKPLRSKPKPPKPPKPPKCKVEIDGNRFPYLKAVAAHYGISYGTVWKNYKHGLRGRDLVTLRKRGRKRKVTA